MSIDRLKYFAAVVETRSLRRAAEIVGISAPSMSKAISVLEDELGQKLLYPEGRGIGITPKGLDVYKNSIALLNEYQKFQQKVQTENANPSQVRIGTFEVFSTYFMSGFLRQEKDREVRLIELTPGQIEDAVLAGTIDLGITYLPSPSPMIEYREIGSFKMGIYGLKTWKDIDFEKWPFAVPITNLKILSSDNDALDMWPTNAPSRYIKYRFELLETALQTSRNGLSVLHCPDFIIGIHNKEIKSNHQLVPLGFPVGYKTQKLIRAYLVGRKGALELDEEGKFARFFRSLD